MADPLPTVRIRAVVATRLGAPNECGGHHTEQVYGDVDAEVLTVHLAKRTMRVRFEVDSYGTPKTVTRDVDAEPFFARYGWPRD